MIILRKRHRSLHQFCRYKPKNSITHSKSFKFKTRFLDNTNNNGIINVEIAAALKILNHFLIALEIPLIKCKISLKISWPASCAISEWNRVTAFAITDTKLSVSIVTLTIQDNTKSLQELKSGFQRSTNWNQSKFWIEAQNNI